MNCPYCQAENDETAEGCFKCGRSLYSLTEGRILDGRYQIQKLLGKGGMGMVYKAHDQELDEVVAVKVLRPDIAGSDDAARRFRSEIKLARKVRHRNVCGIHEYGQDGHLRYIAMEYVDGVNLKEVLRRRGLLPPEEAFEVSVQVAKGLQAIHLAGVVHRDLKTPNIMVDGRGQVRLMDFGIAKSETEVTGHTATGLIVGTPEYMSPEQARGEKVDARSDIYALGIVLYEIFCGDVPFRGDTPVATLLKQMNEEPPLVSPQAAGLPPMLRRVLEKALAKKREDRYSTAQEMVEALRVARSEVLPDVMPTPLARPIPGAVVAAASIETDKMRTPVPTPSPTPVPAPTPMPGTPVPPASPDLTYVGPGSTGAPPPRAKVVVNPPPARQKHVVNVPQPATPAPPASAATPTVRSHTPMPSPSPVRTASPGRPAAAATPRASAARAPAGSQRLVLALAGAVGALVIVVGIGWALRSAPEPEAAVSPSSGPTLTGAVGSALPSATIPVPSAAPTSAVPSPIQAPTPAASAAATPAPPAASAAPPEPRATPRPQPTRAAAARTAPTPAPTRATPTPVPAVEAKGVLRLRIRPYAQVFVDGAEMGTTPALRTVELPPGDHVVRLVHPDYQPLQRRVTIVPGENYDLQVNLAEQAFPRSPP